MITAIETPVNTLPAVVMKDGFEWIDLEDIKPSEDAIRLSPGDFALKQQVLPLELDGAVLVVAIGAPESLAAADDLGVLLQMPTRAVLASPILVREKIEEIFPRTHSGGAARRK